MIGQLCGGVIHVHGKLFIASVVDDDHEANSEARRRQTSRMKREQPGKNECSWWIYPAWVRSGY